MRTGVGQINSRLFLVFVACIGALVSLVLLPPGEARATVMRLLPLEELVANADVILVATAGPGRSEWDPPQSKIFTYTLFTAEAHLKRGSLAGSRFEVEQMGGTVGHLAMVLAGAPHFLEGEKYLLFLLPADSGRYKVLGLAQGAFRLEIGRSTVPSSRYRRDLEGLLLLDPGGTRLSSDLDPLFGEGLASGRLVEKVLALLRRAADREAGRR